MCSYSQHKLSNFAHAHDPFITRITRSAKPLEEMERRVRKCLDVHGHQQKKPSCGKARARKQNTRRRYDPLRLRKCMKWTTAAKSRRDSMVMKMRS